MSVGTMSTLSTPLSNVLEPSGLQAPSSPLTLPSRSPSPPPQFFLSLPTPPPSQHADKDVNRPSKRRKIERSDRTTYRLDLTQEAAQAQIDRDDAVQRLQRALRKSKKIVVFAGAGISVSAGIPDFRSSTGLFQQLKDEHKIKGTTGKHLFSAAVYSDATTTSQFHDMVRGLSELANKARPTVFHEMVARLAVEKRLVRLYTQNIDELETRIPPLMTQVPLPHPKGRIRSEQPNTIQLHGGLDKMTCDTCKEIFDFEAERFRGSTRPHCPNCLEIDDIRTIAMGKRSHGIGHLRPRIVLYNEPDPEADIIGAYSEADLRKRPDCVIVVGTSMKIPGLCKFASEMCKIVRGRGDKGMAIWINPDPEPSGQMFEDCWDLIVKGTSDQVAELVDLPHWTDPEFDQPKEYTDSDVERIDERQGRLQVNVSAVETSKRDVTTTGVFTPPVSTSGTNTPNMLPVITSPHKSLPMLKLFVTEKSKIIDEKKGVNIDFSMLKDLSGGKRKTADIPVKKMRVIKRKGHSKNSVLTGNRKAEAVKTHTLQTQPKLDMKVSKGTSAAAKKSTRKQVEASPANVNLLDERRASLPAGQLSISQKISAMAGHDSIVTRTNDDPPEPFLQTYQAILSETQQALTSASLVRRASSGSVKSCEVNPVMSPTGYVPGDIRKLLVG